MTFEYALDRWTCMSKLFFILPLQHYYKCSSMTENVPLTSIDRLIFTQFSLDSLVLPDRMSGIHHIIVKLIDYNEKKEILVQ